MWSNKGTYGHYGGLVHAGLNALGTAIICSYFYGYFLLVFMVDFFAHYHIDWAKMNINRITGWSPNSHPQFWWLTGFDQFLHQVTYLGILALIA